MSSLHEIRRDHEFDPACFGCKAATLTFNDTGALLDMDRRERRLTDDLSNYRSMRRQGLQPEHVKGSAELAAKARNRHEIEHASLMRLPEEARGHIEEAAQVATEIPQAMSREAG